MSKDLVTKWFNKIGSREKNKPLLILSGKMYSPQQVYDEVMRNSSIGNQLQALIEQGKYGTTYEEEQELIKRRLTMSLEEKPKDKILFVALAPTPGVQPKAYTAPQLIQEIKIGSKVGKQWIDNEKSYMLKVLAVR